MSAQILSLFPDVNPSMTDPPATKVKNKPAKKEKYTPEFEAFWTAYPRKLNCSKLMAFRAWNRLDDDEQQQAAAALPTFCRMMRGKDEQFVPHAATWLNQKRFETIQAAATPRDAGPPKRDWAAIMRRYRITCDWKQEHGPAPGRPNCQVPPEFLGDMD